MTGNLKSSPRREARFSQLNEDKIWDVVIIGGGASGAGIAVDAASRGFSTLLFDAQDFSAGTSSRSTKLIHGGVRYMKNPRDWKLVREAMIERKLLLGNAPHLVHAEPFILPCYRSYEREYYMAGLGLYAAMAWGGYSVGKTEWLSAAETIRRLPGVKPQGLKGGVQFWDAKFDDARLNIALMKTAEQRGAFVFNYTPVVGFERGKDGEIVSVKVMDKATQKVHEVKTRMVFNAAGVWVDVIRKLVNPSAKPFIQASRGSHLMVDIKHFGSKVGMFIPKTSDGRVLYCIPWNGMLEIGTTDIAEREILFDPKPTEEEVDFMLDAAKGYLGFALTKSDIKASFTGYRPLFNPNLGGSTASVSREHSIICEFKNMITVTGGKWTAYRNMAEHAMSVAVDQGLIYKRPCATKYMSIYRDEKFNVGSLGQQLLFGGATKDQLIEFSIHVRDEAYAMCPEDVLYRRLRLGQLDEKKTAELMPLVAEVFE